MAVRFYDEAFVNKLKDWVKDPNLRILKPDETTRFFEMRADMKDDKPFSLPVIAVSRDKDIEILNPQKQPKTFDGFLYSSDAEISMPINAIPIRIGYQIDIYTKKMAECDEYVRNFVFNFINYPKLTINIPYNNVQLKHQSNILLQPNISDNSDIKEHLFPDQFTRFTLKVIIDDAYLFSIPKNTSAQFEQISVDTPTSDEEIVYIKTN